MSNPFVVIEAVMLAEKGDTSALVKALKEGNELDDWEQELIADWIERHNFKKKPGRQKAPVYMSDLRDQLAAMNSQVTDLMKAEGLSVKDACEKVAARYADGFGSASVMPLPKGKRFDLAATLSNYRAGKHARPKAATKRVWTRNRAR
jgi:hypothetical protein